MAFASALVASSGVAKFYCARAKVETMNNIIPLSNFVFISIPLAVTEFTVFAAACRHLPWLLAILVLRGELTALRPALLLRLPVG